MTNGTFICVSGSSAAGGTSSAPFSSNLNSEDDLKFPPSLSGPTAPISTAINLQSASTSA